jgi:hypothetical protein
MNEVTNWTIKHLEIDWVQTNQFTTKEETSYLSMNHGDEGGDEDMEVYITT